MLCGGLSFNIRSFGSWVASTPLFRLACHSLAFQYPLFRIVGCFVGTGFSALCTSRFQYPLFRIVGCFNNHVYFRWTGAKCFNIRSFGSWVASTIETQLRTIYLAFQYPLFRIVGCFTILLGGCSPHPPVSISALSDRGLLLDIQLISPSQITSFNIRSFGSWVASSRVRTFCVMSNMFQYPLFRIVGCFSIANVPLFGAFALFQYPLFRIVGCFSWFLCTDFISQTGFNIRSFGSWVASPPPMAARPDRESVSISALSDRGLLHMFVAHGCLAFSRFQYPLFRIVGCF